MNLLKTESFELACNIQGSETAGELALVLPGRLDTKDYPHMKSHVEYLASRGYLALSFDHRVQDGANAAEFMNTLIRHIEDPASLT